MANSTTEDSCYLYNCLGFVSVQNMFIFSLSFEWKNNYMLSLFPEAYRSNWNPIKKKNRKPKTKKPTKSQKQNKKTPNPKNFAGLGKCSTVLSLLICPRAAWYNWVISQNFSANGRIDVLTKLENVLISWLNLIGLLVLWWLVWYAIASAFALCECSMWMKLERMDG